MAFPKEYRLHLATPIQATTSFSIPPFVFKLAPNKLSHNRYGIVVSKRVDKRATKRNEIRRLVLTCLQRLDETLQPGYDMLCIVTMSRVPEQSVVDTLIQNAFQKQGLRK